MAITNIITMTIIAFVLGFTSDYIYTLFHNAMTKGKAFSSANWGLLFGIIGIIHIYIVVEQRLAPIIGDIIGAWLGCFISVKIRRN